MEVKEVMTSEACTCAPETNLAAAAMLMWESDCGVLPVVDDARKVVGMITDRDICMAAAMRPLPMSEILVSEVISGQVHACLPETDIREALKTIQREKVHRLAIVGTEGDLQGVLSMNDIALEAKEASGKKANGLSYKDVVETYKALCEHRTLPQPVEAEPLQQNAAAG